MKGPERIGTARLVLRKPTPADAEAIFFRYASDPEVTQYLSWPRHGSIEQTRSFLAFSDEEWDRWPAGPYLIEMRSDRTLLGGTGLAFKTPATAETGYVLARDAWGHGYATEALGAIVAVAPKLGVRRLVSERRGVACLARCHVGHSGRASLAPPAYRASSSEKNSWNTEWNGSPERPPGLIRRWNGSRIAVAIPRVRI